MRRVQHRELTRRDLLREAGMLTVEFALPGPVLATEAGAVEALSPGVNPARLDTWLAVAADGRPAVRTGNGAGDRLRAPGRDASCGRRGGRSQPGNGPGVRHPARHRPRLRAGD